MKANELKIGNYVNVELHIAIPLKIEAITGSSVSLSGIENNRYTPFTIDRVKPIPLTEEWLKKFGFKKLGDWFIKKPLSSVNEYAYNPYIKQFDVINGSGEEIDLVELKYVHQLQNLYFALTGEELEIKKE